MKHTNRQRIEDCVRTIMHNARSIPIRVVQRGPSEGPPGDLGEVTTADDMQRFEWTVRTVVARAVRSGSAARREKAKVPIGDGERTDPEWGENQTKNPPPQCPNPNNPQCDCRECKEIG